MFKIIYSLFYQNKIGAFPNSTLILLFYSFCCVAKLNPILPNLTSSKHKLIECIVVFLCFPRHYVGRRHPKDFITFLKVLLIFKTYDLFLIS